MLYLLTIASGVQYLLNVDKSLRCALPGGSTGEEDDAFKFAVVEEIVERPHTAFLTVRVRRQVWVVTVTQNITSSVLYSLQ